MVYLKVKRSETDIFLYEAKHDAPLDQVVNGCVAVNNQVARLQEVIHNVEDLVKYGPARPPEKVGLDDEEGEVKDPTARRIGIPPAKQNIEEISKCVDNAKSVLNRHVDKKEALTLETLKDLMADISGSITKAYLSNPLPAYDPITEYLFDDFKSEQYLDQDTTSMWFAGKELQRSGKLMDIKSVGKNDKSVIIVKLQKKGGGAPARETGVTEEMQKNLMSYYYKKQEEEKKLMDDDDDSHFNSEWSNPSGLKNHFQGIGNVSWK
ncbi:hypothetical protein AKO1_010800 [Acrasis kona]|uniref:Uncharacterized protein n=1 Tax=Acrasis kona TaxID=1008807 RepID=A0AAW2YM58_9EUKA